jgi:hypothetical protein
MKVQKFIKVDGNLSSEQAIKKAEDHYKKLKYVVYSSEHVGMISEEDTHVNESTDITLNQRRHMKVLSLATGCTDIDKLYEYVTSLPFEYSSLVDLKENFKKYTSTL